MPLLPAAVMPVRAARVLVELMDTPGRVNLRLLFMDSDMASVKRKAVESFNTCFVSGSLSMSTFPLWSSILVKNRGFVYTPPLAMEA